MLLPFACSRDSFTVPNPTLFQETSWPVDDLDDPSDSWNLSDFQNQRGMPGHDLYGNLHDYVAITLSNFHNRIKRTGINLVLYNLDAKNLPEVLDQGSFARIECANLCEYGFFGVKRTVELFLPLLQPRARNPHATLITTFIAAAHNVFAKKRESHWSDEEANAEFVLASRYIHLNPYSTVSFAADEIYMFRACSIVRDWDAIFQQYMDENDFDGVERSAKATEEGLTLSWVIGIGA